jgi:Ca-activated chloride channel homolog
LKRFIAILTGCFIIVQALNGQYYIRGEIKDEKNNLLPNARILMHSNKYLHDAGSSGTFGLFTTKPVADTFTIYYDGYETVTLPVFTAKYNEVKMKMLPSVANMQRRRLSSITKDLNNNYSRIHTSANETYSELIENEMVMTRDYPLTGFTVNIDRASYSNIRRFINMKSRVPVNAVRIEEMINYFNLAYFPPEKNKIFSIRSQITDCPWEVENRLLLVNISAKKIPLEQLPPSNLVFLIDNSGSMELPNRLPLLKMAFRMLVNNLRAKDTITLVTYGGIVDVVLPPTGGDQKEIILRAIEELEAAGDTPGESAIRLAYQVARNKFNAKGNNRVILATDGDFNVGIADEAELEKMISFQRQNGIYLTCLGVGMGNYKDSKLEALARKGNGNFAYLDTEAEAEKVLVKEMSQTLFTVADKVYMNVRFDKRYVKNYRLLGFENKRNAVSDTGSRLEGGEVGSGYSSLVVFEISPTSELLDALKSNVTEDAAYVLINYTDPGDGKQNECSYNCGLNYLPMNELGADQKLAIAVAMFGGYLRESKYMKTVTPEQVLALCNNDAAPANLLHKEFCMLVEKAKKIYMPEKVKKKKKRLLKKEE